LNQAAFFEGMIVLYPILFVVGLLVYLKGMDARDYASDKKKSGHRPFHTIYPYALIIVAGLAYYFLSARSHFLGDGYTLISQLANPDSSIKMREFGEMFLHRLFFGTFGPENGHFARFTYQIISAISGLIFVIGLLYYTRKLTRNPIAYYAFIGLNFLAAGTVHFFGYVENYSIVTAVLYLMLLSGLASLKRGRKSIVPVVAFIVAIFLHSISLVYLPALLIYLVLILDFKHIGARILEKSKLLLSAMAATFVLFYAAVKLWAPMFWKLAFLPPLPGKFTTDDYYLFSPAHLVDFINLILFLMPVTVIVWVVYYQRGEQQERKVWAPETLFLAAACLSGLLAAFTLEPKLGMARDWDLMSTMLIGGSLTGIYLWILRFSRQPRFRAASLLLGLLSLSVFIPWLSLHNSIKNQYEYNLALMELDPKHGRSGFYTMISFHERQGNRAEAARLHNYCRINFPEVYLVKEAEQLYRDGEYDRAVEILNRAREHNPGWYVPYFDLGVCRIETGEPIRALQNLKTADALNPYNEEINRLIDSLENNPP